MQRVVCLKMSIFHDNECKMSKKEPLVWPVDVPLDEQHVRAWLLLISPTLANCTRILVRNDCVVHVLYEYERKKR